MTVTIQKWGNSLGVRIPKAIAHATHLEEGTEVELAVKNGKVVLKPVEVPSLKELLSQITPGSRPAVVDWGRPVGKEVW
jgi:antitoxin MazE